MPDPSLRVPPDPYAPPHLDVQRATPLAHAPGRALALLYGAAVLGNVLARVSVLVVPSLFTIASWATKVCGLAVMVLAMAWLYAAWKGLPESHRGTITPRRAALSLLIPLYDAYWGLAINLALCNTLDGMLERTRESRRAPRTQAVVAWAGWLGSYVVSAAATAAHRQTLLVSILTPAVTGGLWLAYMLECDRARDAVARIGDDPARLGAPRLSQIQRQRGPGWLAAVALGVFLLLCLVVWQILAPGERPSP
jgi:hypothetical protein